jgi:hypothetical protein
MSRLRPATNVALAGARARLHDASVGMSTLPRRRLRRCCAALLPLALAGMLVTCVLPAGAAVTGRAMVSKRGGCSGPSGWKLVLHKGSGTVNVTFSVHGGASGQKWNVFMEDNGKNFYNTSRVSGSGGTFTVKRGTNDRAGTDKILVGGNNAVTGEACVGRASI